MAPNDVPTIPFNRPSTVGAELDNIREAIERGQLAGDGEFTRRCHDWLTRNVGGSGALLTHSCTGALEMAAILADLGPGDEAILPSYTFVSTANAVALRGATPVFVDVREDTLNIDETCVEEAVTERTRAIIAVHYAGVCAEMDAINETARKHGLFVIEDAAQALLSTYKGRQAGTMSDASCFSFHETKNIISGEGGALLLGDKTLHGRAEIIREKGTNRSQFFRGMVDKYTWVDLGSSYLPGELVAAFLYAQLEKSHEIMARRLTAWARYHDAMEPLEAKGVLRRPSSPEHCRHNGHMYYILTDDLNARSALMAYLKAQGVTAPFHYVPLHSSPAGKRLGRTFGDMSRTNDLSDRLIRLPMFFEVEEYVDRVIDAVTSFFE